MPTYDELIKQGAIPLSENPSYEDLNAAGATPYQEPTLTQAKTPFIQKVSDFLGMTPFAKHEAAQIARLSGVLPGKLGEGGRQFNQLYNQGKTEVGVPTNKQVLGSAIQLGANLATPFIRGANALTVPKRIFQSGAQSAVVGGALGFGSGLEQEKSVGQAVGQGALSGAISGGIGAGAQALVELGKLLASPIVKEGIYNKALGIKSSVLEKGKSPAKTFLAEGKFGTGPQLKRISQQIIDDSESKIDDILTKNPSKFNSGEVTNEIKTRLQEKFSQTLSPVEVDDLVTNLPLDALSRKKSISAAQLNQLRKQIDNNFLGNTKWLNNSTAERTVALKTAANTMRELVKTSDERLPSIFSRYADAVTANRALTATLAKPHILTNLFELLISGGVGTAISGGDLKKAIKNGAATYVALKTLHSPLARTFTAQALQKTGQVVPKIASQGVPKFAGKVGTILEQNLIKNVTK